MERKAKQIADRHVNSNVSTQELIMKVRHAIALSALTLFGSAVYAADSAADADGLSRAAVKASVIAARAAGQLLPAGDAADYMTNRPTANRSTLTRAEVKAQVLEARAEGELQPAGEAASYSVAQSLSSDRSRAEVKAEVLAARAAGELTPAGEGALPEAEITTPRKPALRIFARAPGQARVTP